MFGLDTYRGEAIDALPCNILECSGEKNTSTKSILGVLPIHLFFGLKAWPIHSLYGFLLRRQIHVKLSLVGCQVFRALAIDRFLALGRGRGLKVCLGKYSEGVSIDEEQLGSFRQYWGWVLFHPTKTSFQNLARYLSKW